MSWIDVDDFTYPAGWASTVDSEDRPRWYCQQLEEGQILCYAGLLFDLPEADRQLLLSLRASGSAYHKNISYRPREDRVRGFDSGQKKEAESLHRIMRSYSAQLTETLTRFLAPYAGHWTLDFASFRPLEEQGRDLPLHKRNDLLHVDAFPSRPTHGGRILRVFSNINPDRPRVWLTTDRFHALAKRYAVDAGLPKMAARSSTGLRPLTQGLTALKKAVGLRTIERSAYDQFMLRFHDYLKENSEFQKNCAKTRLEFPSGTTWMVFTDGVPHAALSGQFALEQTFIIPPEALVAPQHAPLRILEGLCGHSLVS